MISRSFLPVVAAATLVVVPLSVDAAVSWTPEYSLELRGPMDAQLVHSYRFTTKMSKEQHDYEHPHLAQKASDVLAGEFLGILNPGASDENIKAKCTEDETECKIDEYVVKDGMAFTFRLILEEYPLPGVDQDKTEYDDHGFPKPKVGTKAVVRVEAIAGEKIDGDKLKEFGDHMAEILQLENPEKKLLVGKGFDDKEEF